MIRDLMLAFVFLALIIAPAIIAMRSGSEDMDNL